MFDTFARLLSSIPTFLFPVFASYKALNTSDPALLRPWLMYWVVLACALLAESWVGFILVWIPFYSWIRLFFLLYLILPQTQGAKVLYQEHVQPFLETNEHSIDEFIASAHDRAKAAGLTYLRQAIEFIKENLLGLPPREPTPPATPRSSAFSYTQGLLARFNLPSARPSNQVGGSNSTANDFYSLLASAVSAATTTTGIGTKSRDLSNSGILIPPTVNGEDRMTFITAQRERLSILLSALDKEASNLQGKRSGPSSPRMKASFRRLDGAVSSEEDVSDRPKTGNSEMSTRKSEPDFEKIEAESGTEDLETPLAGPKRPYSGAASWMPWSWGAKAEEPVGVNTVMKDAGDEGKCKSSGVDI